MPDSYFRSCRTCGRRIQMRKMPQGQWVAFEGYENQHRCQQPPANPRPLWVGSPPPRPTAPPRTTPEPGFADIEVPDDIDLGEPAASPPPARPSARRRARVSPSAARPARSAHAPSPPTTPETGMTSGQKWVVAIVIVVALIVAYNVWLRPRSRSLIESAGRVAALVLPARPTIVVSDVDVSLAPTLDRGAKSFTRLDGQPDRNWMSR